MRKVDISTVGKRAVQVGLLTSQQINDAIKDLPPDVTDCTVLIRALERKGFLTPFQSQKLLKNETEGYFLGEYRILYKIASGSFGRVFRADDPKTGKVVAIKVLRKKMSQDPRNIQLFEREGQLGKKLTHPNVVEILDVRRDPASGQYYIVMEFVEGGNLRDFLAIRKKLEPAEALRLLEDCVTGLAYAYGQGLTHRDIKLTNILISSQGRAKLVDFGLASMFGHDAPDQNADLVDRTVDYAGLERATGVMPGDIRSDIFFLGCVTYQMLTGRSPLDKPRNASERMQKERFTSIAPMSRDELVAPPEVFQLVETMMHIDPLKRHQTPIQFLEAIRTTRRSLENSTQEREGPPILFILEKDTNLQDILRTRLKDQGFRVFIASEPARAVERFRQQPYDALIVDALTTGKEGLATFERVLTGAEKDNRPCAGILMVGENQSQWTEKIRMPAKSAVLVQPIRFKQLTAKIRELLNLPEQQKKTQDNSGEIV